jgi:hypothetical protein
MKRLIEFLTKPRGIYFSIVAVLTLTMFLMTISFSYYVPTSTYRQEMQVKIDNVLSIDDYDTNTITFNPHEEKEITFRIKSNSTVDSLYYIYYDNNANISFEIISSSDSTLEVGEEETVVVKFTNLSEEETTVDFYSAYGFIGKDIEVDGTIIQ